MKISDIVKDDSKYLGHIGGKDNPKESLQDHMDKCFFYYKKIKDEKNLSTVYKRLYLSIFDDEKYYDIFEKLIDATISSHDLGKINSRFQRIKLFNLEVENCDLSLQSEHSILSSFLYVYFYFEKIMDMDIEEDIKEKFYYLIFINAFIISRHHSDLSDFKYHGDKFLDLFYDEDEKFYKTLNHLRDDENIKTEIFNRFDEVADQVMDEAYEFIDNDDLIKFKTEKSSLLFIYSRLIYSTLVASDFYSTTNYMSNFKTDLPKLDQDKLIEIYNNSDLIKGIRKKQKDLSYKDKNDINDLRTDIFLRAEKNLNRSNGKNIFFLESPTGSGKSNAAMNLSYKLLDEDINKIIYAYPFNTLVEQNKNTLLKFYKDTEVENSINVINSITPIGRASDESFMKEWDYYIKSLLDRQFLHSPFIITSNIALFNTLFSNKRKEIFGLYQLTNSVIVLDEIQAYKESLWNEIIEMLELYAEILNIKIIIMSATLPDLSKLLSEDKKDMIEKLIKKPKEIFSEPMFKNRVRLNYDLLDKGKIEYVDLISHMKDNIKSFNKVLLEFIRKKDAEEFFNLMLEDDEFSDFKILILTGDDNLKRKSQVIKEVSKDNIKVILIATQVVEAGVDIDMDIGYKDISKLENEEQFLGRINRSTKKENSVAYFFDMADEKTIYKNIEDKLTLRNKERRKDLEEKNFANYFKLKLKKSNDDKNEYSYKKFERDLINLNFKEISDHMQLIDDEEEKLELFLNKDDESKDIWLGYVGLITNNDMDYSEKIVKLSEKRALMSDYIYNISKRNFNNYIESYNDNIGNIYYIEDCDRYLKNGRLNLEEIDLYKDII